MNDTQLHTLDQVEAFLVGTEAMDFSFADTAARYARMEATRIRFGYLRLGQRPKGVLRRYLPKVSRCRAHFKKAFKNGRYREVPVSGKAEHLPFGSLVRMAARPAKLPSTLRRLIAYSLLRSVRPLIASPLVFRATCQTGLQR